MIRTLVTLAATAAVTFGPAAPVHVDEDDPRWDCRTMGNHTCGVPGPYGQWLAVHFGDDGTPDWAQSIRPGQCESASFGRPGEDQTVRAGDCR